MAARHRAPDPPTHAVDAREVLVNVLCARIDRAYMTVGSAGGRRFVRQILERINTGALMAVISELGLDKEVTREVTRLDGD
jgi:hypothetical protein